MNCKPGDLARIVCPRSINRDRLVRCIRLLVRGEEMTIQGVTFQPVSGEGFWAVEGRLSAQGIEGGIETVPGGPIHDRWLRPIRDPGEDAVDETLQRLSAPSRDEVMA
ncbi:hypothetical protein ACEN9J_02990 [Variovorax sp. Varisp41]|uniref:hypothetical protein n=1 Tax=Variovorax sp. Varisp41 TaxID=3243033 RepID=UPI0039B47A38